MLDYDEIRDALASDDIEEKAKLFAPEITDTIYHKTERLVDELFLNFLAVYGKRFTDKYPKKHWEIAKLQWKRMIMLVNFNEGDFVCVGCVECAWLLSKNYPPSINQYYYKLLGYRNRNILNSARANRSK